MSGCLRQSAGVNGLVRKRFNTIPQFTIPLLKQHANMRSSRMRRSLYQPLRLVRVSRRRTNPPLSNNAQSLINLFSHAYDHSYDLLQETDDIERIADALRVSIEAVKAAKTARSSQEDTDNASSCSSFAHDIAQAINGQEHADNNSTDNEEQHAAADNAAEDATQNGDIIIGQITQASQLTQASQPDEHPHPHSDSTQDDAPEDDSFIEHDNTSEEDTAEDTPYSEGSTASKDMTDSEYEYDDDVSEVFYIGVN